MSAGPSAVELVTTSLGAVAIERAGRGRPLLCLHGIGSSARSFHHLLAAPPSGWEVMAWDAPGYRRSQDPAVPPDLDAYADVAIEVLDALVGDDPAVVLGVSWGGVIATRSALRHPSRVQALVLVASSVGSGADPVKAAAMRQRGELLAAIGPTSLAAERGPLLVSPTAPDGVRRAVVDEMARSIRLPGYEWAARSMAATDHRPDLAAVAAPVLVVAGTADDITGPDAARVLHAGLVRSELRLLPGAGHLANQDHPDALDAVLDPFLSSLPPQG